MLTCALDLGPTSLTLVLMADSPDEAPEFLEGQTFPRSVEPERILAQLEAWREYYGCAPDRVALSHGDLVPLELLAALSERGLPLEWVDEFEVREALAIWRAMQPDPGWLRGGVIALLVDAPLKRTRPGDCQRRAAWDWTYAILRRQVLELEGWLFVEGWLRCPGHLGVECPECDTDWAQPTAAELGASKPPAAGS